MQVYVRHIHKISNNDRTAENDTSGPYILKELDLGAARKLIHTHGLMAGDRFARANRRQARNEKGGFIFFYPDNPNAKGSYLYHCTMVMPLKSELHYKHAPKSHWVKGILEPLFRVRNSDPRHRDYMGDVIGGFLPLNNPYVVGYGMAVTDEEFADYASRPGAPNLVQKAPDTMERGEFAVRRYSLSGETAIYFLERAR